MKYILLFIGAFVMGAPISAQDVPVYEGTQPTWQRIVKDEFRDSTFRGLHINTIIDAGFMYYSAVVDTVYEVNSDPTGYVLKKYDLQDGSLVWSDQKEYLYNLDQPEYYNRLVQNKEGDIVLFGSIKAGPKPDQRPWIDSKTDYSFSTRTYNHESGKEIDHTIGTDTIRSVKGHNFPYRFLDIDRRYLVDNSVFGGKEYFGFRINSYDEHNTIDSSRIVEFRHYMADTSAFIYHPVINYVKDGRMRVAVPGYHRNSGNRLVYDYIKYFEIDFKDINDIHIVDSFDISGRVPDLLPNPALFVTYPEFGKENLYIAQNHWTDGVIGTWINWYDYDGNLLGGHDVIEVEEIEEKMHFTFTNMNINDRYFAFHFLGDSKQEAVMVEISPYFLPRELGRIHCTNYELTRRWNLDYDEEHHQVIITTLLDNDYNYIAAFDADSLGIPRSTQVIEPVRIDYTIYPTVSRDMVHIEVADGFDGEVQVYATDGRLVDRKKTSFDRSYTLDVGDLSAGMYMLRLMSKTVAYESKSFVKE